MAYRRLFNGCYALPVARRDRSGGLTMRRGRGSPLLRTTPTPPELSYRCAGVRGVRGSTVGRAHRACAPGAVPCAVPGRADQAGRRPGSGSLGALDALRWVHDIGDLLTELQHLPRDLEVLAFEAG